MTRQLADSQAVLVSDYGKGVCTPAVVRQVIAVAVNRRVPVLVDPAANVDFSRYAGATLLVPNRCEAEFAVGFQIDAFDSAIRAGRMLQERSGAGAVLIKLDRDGMVLINPDSAETIYRARPRDVWDVTGAGDLVLAVLGLCAAAGMSLEDSAALANTAAGLEVERHGVVPVTRSEILEELRRSFQPKAKLVSIDELVPVVARCRAARRTIVFTNGCFDLLHVGHVNLLQNAAAEGDVLIVAVNGDASVRRLKGPARPVVSAQNRALLLTALECVDYVVVFDEDTPCELLKRLQPDVLVKGGTYRPEEVVGREIVEWYGGRVCVTPALDGISTTSILRKADSEHTGNGLH